MAVSAGGPVPVLFVHYGTDWIRGSERCLLDLLRHLDRDRFRPIAWCNTPVMAEAIASLGVPVSRSRFPILLDWAEPRFDVRGFARLVREGADLVRRHGIRLVHANSAAPTQWMLPVARRARLPLVTHLHANYDLRGRCTFGLHHATLVAGVSRATVQGLLDDGVPAERVRVVHNGVDRERLGRGDATRLRSSLGIAPTDVVLSCVGSLIHRKGIDVLLHAFARLRHAAPDVHLLVIGDGPERDALVALAGELGLGAAAHFLGERDDVGAILRDAVDVSVSASRDEALALFLLEAMAFGRPVVATNVGGTAEAVDDGVTGYLVGAEDPVGLADLTQRLVRDTALRRRFGEAARRRAERDFSAERMVAQLCALYDELLARPARQLGWTGPHGPLRPWGRFVGGVVCRRLGLLRR
jgi:hypothetical protein